MVLLALTQTEISIIAVASAIAVIIGAIMAVWNFTRKIKDSIKEITGEVVEKALENNNKVQGAEFDLKLKHQSELLSKDINEVNIRLNSFTDEQKELHKISEARDNLTRHALVESYKRDIRAIHKKLKATGTISEIDKSYVDKIYPLYRDLGGNSDIAQKVAEINEVYMVVMKENYEKKRKIRKKTNNVDDIIEDLEISTEEKGDN